MRQPLFKLAAENRTDAQGTQKFRVRRRVQTVAAQVRARIQPAQRRNELRPEPGRRVHGQIDRDERGFANRGLIERLPRQVERAHRVPALSQPRRRGRQPKRLPSQFVRRYQNNIHFPISIAPGAPMRFRL